MKIGDPVRYVGASGNSDRYKDSRGIITGLITMHGHPSAHVDWKTKPSPVCTAYIKNLESLMKIDITKPLVIVTPGQPDQKVALLGVDAAGNLIVDLTGTPKESMWMIFTPEGVFHRSPNGGGRALVLKNEEEKITHRFTASFVDGAVFFGPTSGPACDVQIITQGDKITSIIARAE